MANGALGQLRCYLCETPKLEYSLIRTFSEIVCRGCVNYEGSERVEQLIVNARRFKTVQAPEPQQRQQQPQQPQQQQQQRQQQQTQSKPMSALAAQSAQITEPLALAQHPPPTSNPPTVGYGPPASSSPCSSPSLPYHTVGSPLLASDAATVAAELAAVNDLSQRQHPMTTGTTLGATTTPEPNTTPELTAIPEPTTPTPGDRGGFSSPSSNSQSKLQATSPLPARLRQVFGQQQPQQQQHHHQQQQQQQPPPPPPPPALAAYSTYSPLALPLMVRSLNSQYDPYGAAAATFGSVRDPYELLSSRLNHQHQQHQRGLLDGHSQPHQLQPQQHAGSSSSSSSSSLTSPPAANASSGGSGPQVSGGAATNLAPHTMHPVPDYLRPAMMGIRPPPGPLVGALRSAAAHHQPSSIYTGHYPSAPYPMMNPYGSIPHVIGQHQSAVGYCLPGGQLASPYSHPHPHQHPHHHHHHHPHQQQMSPAAAAAAAAAANSFNAFFAATNAGFQPATTTTTTTMMKTDPRLKQQQQQLTAGSERSYGGSTDTVSLLPANQMLNYNNTSTTATNPAQHLDSQNLRRLLHAGELDPNQPNTVNHKPLLPPSSASQPHYHLTSLSESTGLGGGGSGGGGAPPLPRGAPLLRHQLRRSIYSDMSLAAAPPPPLPPPLNGNQTNQMLKYGGESARSSVSPPLLVGNPPVPTAAAIGGAANGSELPISSVVSDVCRESPPIGTSLDPSGDHGNKNDGASSGGLALAPPPQPPGKVGKRAYQLSPPALKRHAYQSEESSPVTLLKSTYKSTSSTVAAAAKESHQSRNNYNTATTTTTSSLSPSKRYQHQHQHHHHQQPQSIVREEIALDDDRHSPSPFYSTASTGGNSTTNNQQKQQQLYSGSSKKTTGATDQQQANGAKQTTTSATAAAVPNTGGSGLHHRAAFRQAVSSLSASFSPPTRSQAPAAHSTASGGIWAPPPLGSKSGAGRRTGSPRDQNGQQQQQQQTTATTGLPSSGLSSTAAAAPLPPPTGPPNSAGASGKKSYDSLRCLMCCERLEDRHFVQCPSVPVHKFCFACSKLSIQQQQRRSHESGDHLAKSSNEEEKIFCPSGKMCLLATERSPWTFMHNEIETIFRESSRTSSSSSSSSSSLQTLLNGNVGGSSSSSGGSSSNNNKTTGNKHMATTKEFHTTDKQPNGASGVGGKGAPLPHTTANGAADANNNNTISSESGNTPTKQQPSATAAKHQQQISAGVGGGQSTGAEHQNKNSKALAHKSGGSHQSAGTTKQTNKSH